MVDLWSVVCVFLWVFRVTRRSPPSLLQVFFFPQHFKLFSTSRSQNILKASPQDLLIPRFNQLVCHRLCLSIESITTGTPSNALFYILKVFRIHRILVPSMFGLQIIFFRAHIVPIFLAPCVLVFFLLFSALHLFHSFFCFAFIYIHNNLLVSFSFRINELWTLVSYIPFHIILRHIFSYYFSFFAPLFFLHL